jgi:hypothetical protein
MSDAIDPPEATHLRSIAQIQREERLNYPKAKRARDQETLDMMRDEFTRIAAKNEATEEIKALCQRAIMNITVRVPLIVQRDKAEREARLWETRYNKQTQLAADVLTELGRAWAEIKRLRQVLNGTAGSRPDEYMDVEKTPELVKWICETCCNASVGAYPPNADHIHPEPTPQDNANQ